MTAARLTDNINYNQPYMSERPPTGNCSNQGYKNTTGEKGANIEVDRVS